MMNENAKTRGCRTLRETAEYLGIGYASVCELARREGFPCIQVGRKKMIPVDALENWLSQQKVEH